MSFLSRTIDRAFGRRRDDGPERLRFNAWTLGGRGADLFEKSAEALELERMNPLRGVDEWRLGQIFDDARDGIYADLAWLYNEIEGVEPALMSCCETRESAAGELGWIVRTADPDRTRGFDGTLADEQRKALLAEFGAVADDLPELAGHMVSAFFRGAAHMLPLWNGDGSLAGFRPLDLWNFAFDRGSGIWYWNADASRDEGTFEPVTPGEIVSLAVSSRHVDHAALPIFIRSALGGKRYGVWLDRFGIPPVGVIMPPNAERGEQGSYMDLARKFARGGSGVLPNGSQVTYGTEARSVCPFPEFIRFQQQQIYAIGIGRVQSGENQGDNLGGNAAGVVDAALRRIVRRDARRIARAVNDCVTRKVLARLFPGRPALAQFDWDSEAKRTGREVLEDAVRARNAGLAIDRGQLEELTGYALSDAPLPERPGGFGGFGAALNSQNPSSGVALPLQNAPRGPGATSVPKGAETRLEAILDDFSAKLAAEMQDEMFSAAADALASDRTADKPAAGGQTGSQPAAGKAALANSNDQPRGKTTPESTPGSFAPTGGGSSGGGDAKADKPDGKDGEAKADGEAKKDEAKKDDASGGEAKKDEGEKKPDRNASPTKPKDVTYDPKARNDGRIDFQGDSDGWEMADKQAKKRGYAGIDDLMRQSVSVPQDRIDAILKGSDCKAHEAVAVLRTMASIQVSDGEQPVKLGEFALRHYVCGDRKKMPDIGRLCLLPAAIRAIRNPDSIAHELDDKPSLPDKAGKYQEGTQTIYMKSLGRKSGKSKMAVYAYTDSGVLSGWEIKRKKPAGEPAGL